MQQGESSFLHTELNYSPWVLLKLSAHANQLFKLARGGAEIASVVHTASAAWQAFKLTFPASSV